MKGTFIITLKEIEEIRKMAVKEKDNIFVSVKTTSLGSVINIKPQGDFKIRGGEWKEITDYDSW